MPAINAVVAVVMQCWDGGRGYEVGEKVGCRRRQRPSCMEAAVGAWGACFAKVPSLESCQWGGFEVGPKHDRTCILERAF